MSNLNYVRLGSGSGYGYGSNSYGQFWYGNSTNFPGFLFKKNVGVGGRRSTKFAPGGNIYCNKPRFLYNKYKPGSSGIGASSISNRRAKNRLATVCSNRECFPCYTTLGQYSNYTHNPNGFIPCPLLIPNQSPPKIIYNSIVINNITRYYLTININQYSLNKDSVLLCFPGGSETMDDFLNFTGFKYIGSNVIVFQGQSSKNTRTFQNSFPWIYNVNAQNDILFVDTVLNKIYNINIPKNIFLTGKSDGAGFAMLYSNLSQYKSNIKAIGICSSTHFGLNSSNNISTFLQSNYYVTYDNIVIPYNIIVPPSHVSVLIIHGTSDTTMPYNGQNFVDSEAYERINKTIWKDVDPSVNEINSIIYSNTFTVNFTDYFSFIRNNNNLNITYNDSNNEYYWGIYSNTNNVVLNTITIIGQYHNWSGHYNSGKHSSNPENFYLDATYLLIKFFKLQKGEYIPTVSTIPQNLKTYDNLTIH